MHNQENTLDKIFLSLFGIFLCLCGIGLLYNHFHQNYVLNFQWLSHDIFVVYTTLFMLYISSFWMAPLSFYCSLILKSFGMLALSCIVLLIGNTTIFTTPFNALYDHFFNNADLYMGFYLTPLLQWVQQHSLINHITWDLYFSVLYNILLFPIALGVIGQRKMMYQFYFSEIIISLMSYTIYYFFPTTSPASVNPHFYFSPDQIHLLNYFQSEHAHHFFNFNMVAVIGFPSLHAAWTMLFIYYLWPYRFVKYVGLIYGLFAMLAILSTGWHFLSDMIAGCIIAIIAVKVAEYLVSARGSASTCQT